MTTRAEPEDHLWSTDHSLRNGAVEEYVGYEPVARQTTL